MAKTKKKRSPAVRRIRRVFGTIMRVFVSIFLVCVMTGCICGCVLTMYILNYIGTIEDIDITNLDMNFTSIIYAIDQNGEPFELSRIHGGENRIPVNYDEMPQHLKDVTVAAEDKRFWEHNGVDWKRTVAAAANMFIPSLLESQQGGSTITQQLIKNATDEWNPTVDRKVTEIFSAIKLQQQYSKEQILEAYLNIASFGNNINGIEAAANFYFNKNTRDLTLLESATIVSITQAPTGNNPITELGEKNNKKRRQFIFRTMKEMGTITDKEYDAVYAQDVHITLSDKAPAQQPNSSNTWFEDHLIEDVIANLQKEKGMSYSDASALLFRGGLQIYATVDTQLQTKLEQMYIFSDEEKSIFPPLRNTIYPESAFIILDLHGQIKAIAGSNRPKQGNRWLDYATQVPRQPGSTMKPISSYLQGIEKDFITWSSVFEDSPMQKPGTSFEKNGFVPWPVNYYNGYDGPQTCVMALQRSVNTIPCKILDFIGPEVSLRFLHDKCGMKHLITPEEDASINDNNLSAMAIGGTTEGVTLLELAGAYQIDANGGTFTAPTSYTLVKDSEGNTLLEADNTPKRVISKETSSILNLMMQQVVVGPRGSGSQARFSGDLAKMPIAGKTGTSSENMDQWFVGVTPYYIGVTWMGFAPRKQPIDYTGFSFPTPILWRNVMEPLHEGMEVKDFEYSSNIVQKQYCTVSGDLASVDCPASLTGWYKTSKIPDICTEHLGVKESEETDELERGSKNSRSRVISIPEIWEDDE